MDNQQDVRNALIEKFKGASNNELLKKYSCFKHVAEMYSQFRSYLFALAKTHPEETLKLLESTDEVIVRSVSRGFNIDTLKKVNISLDVLEGLRYQEVAVKHSVSVASVRVTFIETVENMKLDIPKYYGKKQIIAEYKDKLERAFKQKINELSGETIHIKTKKGLKAKSPLKKKQKQ